MRRETSRAYNKVMDYFRKNPHVNYCGYDLMTTLSLPSSQVYRVLEMLESEGMIEHAQAAGLQGRSPGRRKGYRLKAMADPAAGRG